MYSTRYKDNDTQKHIHRTASSKSMFIVYDEFSGCNGFIQNGNICATVHSQILLRKRAIIIKGIKIIKFKL